MQYLRQYQYYMIIAILSLVSLFFLPMLGSEAGIDFKLPTTLAGWIVYVLSKLTVAGLNLLIFHCFILQAKLNIKDNPNFIEANRILNMLPDESGTSPRSPIEWNNEVYGKKGISIFITSILSVIGLTQAVLTFDWVSMLTYLFTILMGVIFGVLQMNQAELYWTTEYLQYANRCEYKGANTNEANKPSDEYSDPRQAKKTNV